METKRALSMSVVCAFAAVVSTASAHDRIIPGSSCLPLHPNSNDFTIDSNGITVNETVAVYCPLRRDGSSELTKVVVGFYQLRIDEINDLTGEAISQVTCTLYARDVDGEGSSGSVSQTFTFIGTHNDEFLSGSGTFSSTSLNNFSDGTDRAFTLRCSLNTDDGIGGVKFDQASGLG